MGGGVGKEAAYHTQSQPHGGKDEPGSELTLPEAPGKLMAPLPQPLCIPFKIDLPTGTHKCYSLVRQILGQLRSAKSQAPAGLSLPASKQKVTVTAALREGCGAAGPFASSHVRS